MGRTHSAARKAARLLRARWLVLGAIVAACTNDPDIVAHTVTDVALHDAGAALGDASAARDLDAGDASALGATDAATLPVLSSAPDAGCDYADALKNAGLSDELFSIALSCKVPLWWFTQGVSGIDQTEILRILLGQTTVPKSEGRTPDACDLFFGIFYYDDPNNAANVILCPVVCEALKQRVLMGSSLIECKPGAAPDAG